MIAVLLTVVTVGLVWVINGVDPLTAIGHWGGRVDGDKVLPKERGLWSLLGFAMQVCVTLVTGHALATAPAVRRGVDSIVRRVTSPRAAIVVTALLAMSAGLINWALGLIVGALVAREMGRATAARGLRVHYPLLGAAGYTGLMVWHGGLSGTAPLKVTLESEIADILPNTVLAPVPLDETLFSPLNLVVTLLLLVGVPLLLVLMAPRDSDVETIEGWAPAHDPPPREPQDSAKTPAQRLEQSRLLAWILGGLVLTYLVLLYRQVPISKLDLNSVNLAFLGLGLLLHGGLTRYGDAVADAARGCSGIIVQFPFYAGIMGLMALSGLMGELASGVGQLASSDTLGPITFLSAGTLNLFVPSGGGQWAIQGPIVIEAAHQLGVPMGKAVMAFCYGDQWTNMLQPFWALPLLGITGLRAGDIIGYTAALMVLVLPLFILPLVLM